MRAAAMSLLGARDVLPTSIREHALIGTDQKRGAVRKPKAVRALIEAGVRSNHRYRIAPPAGNASAIHAIPGFKLADEPSASVGH
jgi:hypothetical protein